MVIIKYDLFSYQILYNISTYLTSTERLPKHILIKVLGFDSFLLFTKLTFSKPQH